MRICRPWHAIACARPVWRRNFGAHALGLMTQPSGARLPLRPTTPPTGMIGAAVERTIGWLKAFRRLVTRYEFYAFLFHSFAKLACLVIVLRRF